MSVRRTPPIGSRGIFQLREPFSITNTKVFICHAIRSFKDFHELNQDVYNDIYSPVGLTLSQMEADAQLDASIVTLISEDNDIVYVPDTYIMAFPDMGEVKYHRVVLSVDFGILPEYLDFSFLKTELSAVAEQVIGKEANINLHVAKTTGLITPDDHQTLEASRLNNIQRSKTLRALYTEQVRINDALIERLQAYETLLIENNIL